MLNYVEFISGGDDGDDCAVEEFTVYVVVEIEAQWRNGGSSGYLASHKHTKYICIHPIHQTPCIHK